ncbi:hypothetical protein [Vibrio gallaecicus]|uniref:hypothetical protein n=1 Tax=Vibrio gallaecicus TaxID=552386 RepID=UPI0025B3C71A|nr:hypothetical protein [Vibrio gallaecicus]MDN3616022.1 hypothetical protein [Vibrio gallaecicus]
MPYKLTNTSSDCNKRILVFGTMRAIDGCGASSQESNFGITANLYRGSSISIWSNNGK